MSEEMTVEQWLAIRKEAAIKSAGARKANKSPARSPKAWEEPIARPARILGIAG